MPIKQITKEVGEVIGFNSIILSITTFTNIEVALKILLLLVSIVYTIDKWLYHKKQRDEKKKAK
tara:strand:- start:953 stop:1144 length:192 start_codon:yes stop_codon:yes gene_type:complete